MKEVSIVEFDKPMKYSSPDGMLYSQEYIANTPLDELKYKFNKRQRRLHGTDKINKFEGA